MDNATNNDTAMVELERLLSMQNIAFDAKARRIRCYPHIINICVSHIVKSVARVSGGKTFGPLDIHDSEDDECPTDDEDGDGDSEADEFDGNDDDGILEQDPELEEWLEALKKDPVQKARKIVRTVRSSGQRREAFQTTISSGNQMRVFKDDDGDVVALKNLQLLADVKHRWDSLYLMLHRMQELKPVTGHTCLIQYSANHIYRRLIVT